MLPIHKMTNTTNLSKTKKFNIINKLINQTKPIKINNIIHITKLTNITIIINTTNLTNVIKLTIFKYFTSIQNMKCFILTYSSTIGEMCNALDSKL